MRSRRVLLESWRRADMSVTIHSSMSELAEITGQSSLRRPIVHQLGVARSREALYYLSAGFLFLQTGAYSSPCLIAYWQLLRRAGSCSR